MGRGVFDWAKDIDMDQLVFITSGFNIPLVRQIFHPRFGADDVIAVIIGWWMVQVDAISNLRQLPYVLHA